MTKDANNPVLETAMRKSLALTLRTAVAFARIPASRAFLPCCCR